MSLRARLQDRGAGPGKTLVLATHNLGKAREIEALLNPLGLEVEAAGALGLPEPEETEPTFAGNALLKARAAHRATGRAALADDSGFCVRALGGAPGVVSARWAGPDRDFAVAMARVEAELASVGGADRGAWFVCVLALVEPSGEEHVFEGRVEGEVVWPPRGEHGFGYDPIFQPAGDARTFGEMPPAEKLRDNHRARAFARLIEALG